VTEIVNNQQEAMWNGYEGQRWAEEEDRWDALNGVFNDDLFAAAGIGGADRVLDIGCGNGQITRLAARRTTSEAVGIDISVPMLEKARAAAAREGLGNAVFEHGDAQVFPFAAASFDIVVARFGLTFFDDPVAAFTNITRAMMPSAKLATVCVGDYSKGDWAPVIGTMAQALNLQFLNEPNPRDALADPESIERVLTAGGFKDVTTAEVVRPNVWGRDAEDAAAFMLGFGPIHMIYENSDEDTRRKADAAVAAAFQPHAGPQGVTMNTPAWLVTATRP
jgi:ubiquinone/menaquinone biosynthesis C-methylase UbiE